MSALRRMIVHAATWGASIKNDGLSFKASWTFHRSFTLAIPGECRTPVSRKLCDSTVGRSRRLRVDVSSAMSLPAAHGGAPGDQVD